MRFNDRLTTSIEVDPRVLDCRVPNLILQPLVENAIRHGVSQRTAPGHVRVLAERRGDALHLQVSDNGAGLSTQAPAHRAIKGGVGLSNTRARLQQLYGSAYRFELASDPRGGATATLEIPFRSTEPEPEHRTQPGLSDLQAPPRNKRVISKGDPQAVSPRA